MDDLSLVSYLLKVGLSIALLAVGGYVLVFFHRRRVPLRAKGAVGLLS